MQVCHRMSFVILISLLIYHNMNENRIVVVNYCSIKQPLKQTDCKIRLLSGSFGLFKSQRNFQSGLIPHEFPGWHPAAPLPLSSEAGFPVYTRSGGWPWPVPDMPYIVRWYNSPL